MSDFLGYKVELVRKNEKLPYFHFDFSKENLLGEGFEYHEIPFCPLAACGLAVSKLTSAETSLWLKGDLNLNVIDIRDNRLVTGYDIDWMNFELDLEVLAG